MGLKILGWTRLEPGNWGEHLRLGLEARLHDPLWLLARQWQLGELTSKSAGSPVKAELELELAPIRCFYPGACEGEGEGEKDYDPRALPLESLVEEDVDEATLSFAVEAGQDLVERLESAGFADDVLDALIGQFPLEISESVDWRTQAWVSVLKNRVPDGRILLRECEEAESELLHSIPLAPEDEAAFAAICRAWSASCRVIRPATSGGSNCWNSERMEYRFAVATSPKSRRLVAGEHHLGRLDWHSFQLEEEAGDPMPETPKSIVLDAMPSRLELPGMPAAGWWEFEDGTLNLDGVTAGGNEIAKLLLLEMIFISGDEWHLVPVDLEVGHLYRMKRLEIVDTFGFATSIAVERGGMHSSMYCLSDQVGKPAAQFFFLPPTTSDVIKGEARECVTFARDEQANLAWAIEKLVSNSLGKPQDARAPGRGQDHSAESPPVEVAYQLASHVPMGWFPLVPKREENSRQIRFVPLEGQEGNGVILRNEALELREEELKRCGLQITRLPHRSRWLRGKTLSWIGRRKRQGFGEIYRGIDFDFVG